MKTLIAGFMCFFLVCGVEADTRHAPAPKHALAKPVQKPHGVKPIAPVHKPRVTINNYHRKFGVSFRYGYYYSGFNHNHWSYNYWDTRYGAFLYYDPYALQYYYWCAPHFRYYPISYVPLNTFAFPYNPNPQPPPLLPEAPPPDMASPY